MLLKYTDFVNVFSLDLAAKLSKYTEINDYAINLIDNKQLPYNPIFSLESIKLKIIKTYIEINLANSFIRSFKFSIDTPIFFNGKPDNNL